MGKLRHGRKQPSRAKGVEPGLPPRPGHWEGASGAASVGFNGTGSPSGLRGQAGVGITAQVTAAVMQDPSEARGRGGPWVPGQRWGRSTSPRLPTLARTAASLSHRAPGWTRTWAQPPRGTAWPGEGAPRGPRGTGWAALMSGPWHPSRSGCPAAADAWDSCSLPARRPHRGLPCVPHGTGHPTAAGTAWHRARDATRWQEVWGEHGAPGEDTRVAPGAATHIVTGTCRVLPAVPRQVPLLLAALPRHRPASRRGRGRGRAALLPRCPPCPAAHGCRHNRASRAGVRRVCPRRPAPSPR